MHIITSNKEIDVNLILFEGKNYVTFGFEAKWEDLKQNT